MFKLWYYFDLLLSKIPLQWAPHTLINLLNTCNYTKQFVHTIVQINILLGTGRVIRLSE